MAHEHLDALDKAFDDAVEEAFSFSQEIVAEHTDEGTLLKSGHLELKWLDKSIVYDAIHAGVREFGRTPGSMPPVSAIEGWVKRKRSNFGIKNESEIKSIAWAIAKTIKEEGTEPAPYLRPASHLMEENLMKHIENRGVI